MKWLKPYMPEYLKYAMPAWICLLAEVLIDLSLPTLMASVINQGVIVRNLNHITQVGAIMLALALAGSLAGLSRNWLSTRASQDLGTKIRSDLFLKIQSMSLTGIKSHGTATLITRLTNDVMQIQNLSFMLTRIFIRAPLMLIGGIFMAVILNPGMSLILLAVLPLVAILITIRIKRGFPLFRKVQIAIDRVNGVMREYLAGIREVKVFNRMAYEGERFDQANRNLTDLGIKAARSMATIQPLIFILMNGSIILLLWLGGRFVADGHTEIGDIMAFINYFIQILHAMTMMSMIFTAGVRAKTSVDRIGQTLSADMSMPLPQSPADPPVSGSVTMKDVSFRFPGQTQTVLDHVNLAIAPGQTVALIGSTGCGKSTLINLIGRFYDVESGCVCVDGVDVRDMDLAKLRSRIAYVPQQSILFTGTIEDNLRWGQPDATEDEMRQAIQIAQAAEFIEQRPEGMRTRIGQGGVNLSGGQKQRLCIARALMRHAPILIMDDSTSALDIETEQKLRAAIKQHGHDMTLIVVAQRIQSVMDADQILVMDRGTIIDQGKHRALLRRCPVYADIFRSQIGLDDSGKEVI